MKSNKTNTLILLVLIILMGSCTAPKSNHQHKKDALISGNYLINIEADQHKFLRNPLNGWVLYGSPNLDDFWLRYDTLTFDGLDGPFKIEEYANTLYMRISWTMLNPEEDVYGWNTDQKLIKTIEEAKKRNMKLAFRVVVDSQDKPHDFSPAFVKEAGANGFYSYSGKKKVWSPYPDDPVFQDKYAKFIKAFAKEFNDPNVVDFIDGYGLGKWGEAHGVTYKDEANRVKVLEWVTDLYTTHFTKIPLALNYHRLIGVSKSWEEPDSLSEQLLDNVFKKGYILRHDAFGMTPYYLEWEKEYASKWVKSEMGKHKRPIIMEGGWVTQQHRWDLHDPRGYKTLGDVRQGEYDDSKEAKVNMMDFRINETESWFKESYNLVTDFISYGGYRLYPKSISIPHKINSGNGVTIMHAWKNIGWGFCPNNIPQWNYKYKVAFAIIDKKTDKVKQVIVDTDSEPSDWFINEDHSYLLTSTINVPKGDYYWAVAIVDTTNNNEPAIELSTKNEPTNTGWTSLIDLKVK